MPTSEIVVRMARAQDGPRVAKLLDRLRQENGFGGGQASVPLPASNQGPLFVFVAEVKSGDLVGITAGHRCFRLVPGDSYLLLTDIYVLASFQGHGVGTLLVTEAMAHARRIGCDSVSIIIAPANERAKATVRRAGFVPHGDSLLHNPLD